MTEEIFQNVKTLFQESWKGQPLRLIGVALTGLTEDEYEQMSLFEDPSVKEKQRKMDEALDSIRRKFGNDKITRASIMKTSEKIGRKARAQMEDEKE